CLQQSQQRLLAELQAHPAALAACQALLKQQQSTLDCMQQLIDGMLELARVGHLQPQSDAVDCNELAARIVEQLRAQYPDHPVAIRIDCGPPLHADRRLLRSLFYNLLSNAWKFTRTTAAPRVELCRGSEREPTFRLSDNGVGFDMRYAQRL